MGQLSFRFYSITVTGTDSAGNIGWNTCNVVLMPHCYTEKYGCNSTREKYGKFYNYYPKIEEVDDAIEKSKTKQVLYAIAESELFKNTSTTASQPPPTTGEPTFNPTVKPTTNNSCEDLVYIGCSKVSCQDPKKLCDGSWNYPHIANLKGGETSTIYLSVFGALQAFHC